MVNVNPRVLCIDDEPEVLEGLKQNLRKHFNVHLASSGEEALEKIKDKKYAVIVSDMRMPGMSGSDFFQYSLDISPESIRILLTGQSDIDSAVKAINDGKIFRFLNKPCKPQELRSVINSAIEQYQLVTAEKELLHKTLKGSIKLLTDALAITSPLAFGRGRRIHKRVSEVSKYLKLKEAWHLEMAAMLSQLGAISLNEQTLQKVYLGDPLSDTERDSVDKIPALTQQLLKNIPRLERVVKILNECSSSNTANTLLSSSAQILKFAQEVDVLETQGAALPIAISTIVNRENSYSEQVSLAFIECFSRGTSPEYIREISANNLKEGMVVAQDIYTQTGVLFVGKGFEVTEGFAEKVRSFKKNYLKEPLRIVVPQSVNENEVKNAS